MTRVSGGAVVAILLVGLLFGSGGALASPPATRADPSVSRTPLRSTAGDLSPPVADQTGVDPLEFMLETAGVCQAVHDTDGDGSPDCIGQDDAFVTGATVYSYVSLTHVSETHHVKWVWKLPDSQFTLRTTVGPADPVGAASIDLDGFTGEAEVTMFIDGQRYLMEEITFDVAPTARFSYTPTVPNASEVVGFTAANSTDNRGLVRYEWDLIGNESPEVHGRTVSYSFPESGRAYTVTLTTFDTLGLTDSRTRSIYVNTPPTAGFHVTSSDQLAHHVFRVASNATDPDGRIVDYRWDFGADGSVDATGLTFRLVPNATGPVRITHTVVDDMGATETVTETVVIHADTDGDGLSDRREAELGTDVGDPDTDADGLSDEREIALGIDPTRADTDGDGLSDARELAVGTDPTVPDADGDGLLDTREVRDAPTDPTVPDTDGDGLADGRELAIGTDPTVPDTDGD
ncbi:MAG: PKD domain-containing protein, partial [Halodesulfurarchaeum sp.]